MLPKDFETTHTVAIIMLFAGWFLYSSFLTLFGHGTLNSQLEFVRRNWMAAICGRSAKPFDSILFTGIVNSVAFFGSATLLVLAGVLSTFANIKGVHQTMSELTILRSISLELFALQTGLFAFILALCFLSFTYALRKLIYTTALIGALPDGSSEKSPSHDALVDAATVVLSEAIHTLNFGIRGYYYAVASLCLFISPYACILATLLATSALLYRQLFTPTARAIRTYVKATKSSMS